MVYFIAVVLFFYALYQIGKRWAVDWFPDEVHNVPLPGDRYLTLYRLRPSAGRKRNHPVVLCHGLGANRFNLGLPGTYSLAERLRREGYDVFHVELSGSGRSVPGNWLHPGRYDVCFDDYVERDGPAAIRYVLGETGAKQVFWAGHSMGGMIAYGMSQFEIAEKIRGVAAIASPGEWRHIRKLRPFLKYDFLLKITPKLTQQLYTRIMLTFINVMPRSFLQGVLDRANMDPGVTKYACANIMDTTPSKLLRQFSGWMKRNAFDSLKGYDYQANFSRITIPILFMASPGDSLAEASSVKCVYEAAQSKDKTFVVCSKENGFSADYGHGDIIVGREAPREVHQKVVDWFNARDDS